MITLWPWRPIQPYLMLFLSTLCKEILLLACGSVPHITSLMAKDEYVQKAAKGLVLVSKSLSAI